MLHLSLLLGAVCTFVYALLLPLPVVQATLFFVALGLGFAAFLAYLALGYNLLPHICGLMLIFIMGAAVGHYTDLADWSNAFGFSLLLVVILLISPAFFPSGRED